MMYSRRYALLKKARARLCELFDTFEIIEMKGGDFGQYFFLIAWCAFGLGEVVISSIIVGVIIRSRERFILRKALLMTSAMIGN
jgi:hypothetical protein